MDTTSNSTEAPQPRTMPYFGDIDAYNAILAEMIAANPGKVIVTFSMIVPTICKPDSVEYLVNTLIEDAHVNHTRVAVIQTLIEEGYTLAPVITLEDEGFVDHQVLLRKAIDPVTGDMDKDAAAWHDEIRSFLEGVVGANELDRIGGTDSLYGEIVNDGTVVATPLITGHSYSGL